MLERLLRESKYDKEETSFLMDGFTNGFDIGYEGPENRRDMSKNIPIKEGVGSKEELWKKVMSEVEVKRYAGPFEKNCFEHYIQSPIGLVPKAGNKTRQIFHLSYDFKNGNRSLNYHTPAEKCSVKYQDIDAAVRLSLKLCKQLKTKKLRFSKTDLVSAFRILPLKSKSFRWLVLKAEDPRMGKTYYFIDKCLPFGSSISCSHFQRFSNALKHIAEYLWNKKSGISAEDKEQFVHFIINYLDDFLFIAELINKCNRMIRFKNMCELIGVPVSVEKTEWGAVRMIFLGLLLDGNAMFMTVPEDKKLRAINLLTQMLGKRKAKVKELEKLAGFLNFLNKAVTPGRAFTRRMYAKFAVQKLSLKPHHHIMLDKEFKDDCKMWKSFLTSENEITIARPFMDFSEKQTAHQLRFYTDASAKATFGIGCVFNTDWICLQWNEGFIDTYEPNIEFLELYALCIGIFSWCERLCDKRIQIFCDNQAVVAMVNNNTSGCKYCMVLIRKLTLLCMRINLKIFVSYVRSAENILADSLSSMDFRRFKQHATELGWNMNVLATTPAKELWPVLKFWEENCKTL